MTTNKNTLESLKEKTTTLTPEESAIIKGGVMTITEDIIF